MEAGGAKLPIHTRHASTHAGPPHIRYNSLAEYKVAAACRGTVVGAVVESVRIEDAERREVECKLDESQASI